MERALHLFGLGVFQVEIKNRRVLSWVSFPKMDPDMKILVKVINYEVLPGETIRGMAEGGERREASQARVACLGCSIVERCLSWVTLAGSRTGPLEESWVSPQRCPSQGQRGQSMPQLLLRCDQGFPALLCMQAKGVLAAWGSPQRKVVAVGCWDCSPTGLEHEHGRRSQGDTAETCSLCHRCQRRQSISWG